jgi:hypothetical protein
MRRTHVVVCVVAGALLNVMALGPRSASGAQEATPAACPATTEDENAAFITDLFAAVAAGEDVTPFYAAQHIVHTAAGEDRTNSSPSWFTDRLAAYPDRTVTLDQVVAQGDRVARSMPRGAAPNQRTTRRGTCPPPGGRPNGSKPSSTGSHAASSSRSGRLPTPSAC